LETSNAIKTIKEEDSRPIIVPLDIWATIIAPTSPTRDDPIILHITLPILHITLPILHITLPILHITLPILHITLPMLQEP